MLPSISFRKSIRWLPDKASEPTHTVVLYTGGEKGVFLDVRFLKGTRILDWAFAGYRHIISENTVKFGHHIDSRSLVYSEDQGVNTLLPDGTTLEVGEMINPSTGRITPYEEIWIDEDLEPSTHSLFVKNKEGRTWRARVGQWQLAMGRTDEGDFWAWQANLAVGKSMSKILYATENVDESRVQFLTKNTEKWEKGDWVEWEDDLWLVLERS